MRRQGEGELVDSFVTALYALAEHCSYGVLHDELIRDRLVVGLTEKRLSERMQLDSDLTLGKAITMARQSEEVKRQQSSLRGDDRTEACDAKLVDRVFKSSSKYAKNKAQSANSYQAKPQYNKGNDAKCYNCGCSPSHVKTECPAKDVKCHACGKMGYYMRVCKAAKSVHEINEEEESLFLGSIEADNDPWMADIDINNKSVQFKIDTGADVTVIPHSVFKEVYKHKAPPALQKPRKPLWGPGKNPLDVVGFASMLLKKGERELMEDVYVIRRLQTALLGRPASVALKLVARLDNVTMDTLKTNYPTVCSGLGEVQQPYAIKLKPGAQPFSLKTPRRIPLPLMDKVKEELSHMEDLEVISRVEEPTDWCAGMVVVPKKTGAVRICLDLNKLNESVCREKYILPSVEETLGKLAGAKIFSKLDANMGFWQIPLIKGSAKYTTFITPFGRYHFNRLPFGIASAPEHFQNRMTTEVTEGLEGVFCHMDDVLVWGQTQEEHDARLYAVLEKIQKAGITLNVEKCDISKQEVTYLGHVITASGIRPDPSKTEAVRKMEEPKNVSELRSFLGMVNQLGKFIPQLTERDKPLRDLLSKKNCWLWGIDQARAFQDLKDSLISPPVLAMYDRNRETKVSADGSSYGLGSVLLQKWEEDWRPVAYMSRSLTQTEQRYEKEALGLTWACERFRNVLIGRHFELETDHKPLLSLLGSQALDALPSRIQRFQMRLMRYSYSITHVPGKSLWTADTLSRAPVKSDSTPDEKEFLESTNIYVDMIIDGLPASTAYLEELKEQLAKDSVCGRVMQLCEEKWPAHSNSEPAIKLYWAEQAFITVKDGLLLKGDRLVIPAIMRNYVLARLHEGHQGVVKCRERARQSVWWPGLSQQLNELVLNCRTCSKERQNPKEPLMPTQYPGRPWQKLGADLFMLGSKSYLLVVDYASRYVEMALLTPTKSTDVIHHLKSIFARHGIPETLVTDNGPQFSGRAFEEFSESYGFKHITSSPKYPQSNGVAERAVKTVKSLLKKAADPYLALLAYRTTPLQNGYSPAQLLMGRRLRTTVPTLPALLDPALPDSEAVVLRERERRIKDAQQYNLRHRVRSLERLTPGKEVWVTDQKASGTVMGSHNTPRSYILEGPHGTVRRNRHHLIPMYSSSEQSGRDAAEQHSGGGPEPHIAEPPEPGAQDLPPTPRTRSGRAVVRPARLDL
ncbi:uncharacterized protein K02A2.6-like [Gymnodraco acuticeps]|uniref:Gypsy retrotransposon integrase-like protein 1 n=1 Tax=Gymnodraco acuticeps TaxID=8218 RepID=A0A6P8VG89_GYMAC|nr:uncharacterized protein K02A2.6-like [Gymnodraco acuticeps]